MNLVALRQAALVIGTANTAGFALSAALRIHTLTDLVGVGSFVLTALRLSSLQNAKYLLEVPWWDNRVILVNAFVGIWGTRLASYLFYRILQIGEDKRLNIFYPEKGEGYLDAKRSNFPVKLFGFWSIQAIWGFVTMLPVTLLNGAAFAQDKGLLSSISITKTAEKLSELTIKTFQLSAESFLSSVIRHSSRFVFTLPLITLASGVLIEVLADYQKHQYKSDVKTKDHWCDVGLWKIVRYPNYLGEITTWWSIFGLSLPVLASQGLLSLSAGLLSPLFVTGLLLNLSGIPIHERNNRKRYGNDPAYQQYVAETPMLVPTLKSLVGRGAEKKD